MIRLCTTIEGVFLVTEKGIFHLSLRGEHEAARFRRQLEACSGHPEALTTLIRDHTVAVHPYD